MRITLSGLWGKGKRQAAQKVAPVTDAREVQRIAMQRATVAANDALWAGRC